MAVIDLPVMRPRSLFRRRDAGKDAMAGLVLGVESVPDGLASGLLAGVNPVAGLYAYLFGLAGGALFTSTALMAVQGTGAMSIIVADVDLAGRSDPGRSLFTLAIVTGAVMIVAGILRAGALLRFVSNSVMTGFVAAVGVNIVLGQLDDFTGYESSGSNRIMQALDLLVHPYDVDLWTVAVGASTIALIVWLRRTRLGALGLVVAVFVGSGIAAILAWLDRSVALVGDVADVPASLPVPTLPVLAEIPGFLLPAASLAFVGVVQGAGVSAAFPNRDGTPSDLSQDFVGQGAGNIVAGIFQGMPVGGSMSASSLAAGAGARSRTALLMAAVVMAVMIVAFGSVIELVAMPALAGLLIVVGIETVKPAKILAVARTGAVPLTVMAITFALTLVIPLQYSVLVGVAISVLLVVLRQSSQLVTRRLEFGESGRVREVDPPDVLGHHDVVVLQPYGPIFFATAPALADQLPTVTAMSRRSVVILRVRGVEEAGATLLDVLRTYAQRLQGVDSRLMIVTDNPRLIQQFDETAVIAVVGAENVYQGTEYLGETVRRAYEDALAWTGATSAPEDEDGDTGGVDG